MKKFQGRQGDVLIQRRDDITIDQLKEAQKIGQDNVVLAEGEATGHAHRVAQAMIALYVLNEIMLLHIPPEAERVPVTHEEHNEVWLEPGIYEIKRQREYRGGQVQRVMD